MQLGWRRLGIVSSAGTPVPVPVPVHVPVPATVPLTEPVPIIHRYTVPVHYT